MQPFRVLLAPADDGAEQDVVVAREVLRRAVEHEVGAVLEGPQVDRGGRGRVDDHPRGMGRRRVEIRHRQERVRGRLEPDEVGPRRRRARLVELDVAEAPAAELREGGAGAVVRPLR